MSTERHVVSFAVDVTYQPIDNAGRMIVECMKRKDIPTFIKPSLCYSNGLLILNWDWVTPIPEPNPCAAFIPYDPNKRIKP
jgi:hypothetical protein